MLHDGLASQEHVTRRPKETNCQGSVGLLVTVDHVSRNRYSSARSPYLGASVAVAYTNDGDLRDAYR